MYCLRFSGAVICPAQLTPPPPNSVSTPNMGLSADRGGSHLTLADQQQQQKQQQSQQQQQQQWGPSPRAMHALDLYRACLAAGQLARFTVVQRPEGEYFTLSSRPPPPAAAATPVAVAGGKRPGRKPNKKRAEKQRARRECRRSVTAARQHQQPQGDRPARDRQQQQQQQATASSSDMPQHTGAAADSTLQPQTALSATIPAASAAAEMTTTTEREQQKQQHGIQQQRETRSSKKRKVWQSPGTDSSPATPGGIPQVDGADCSPNTPLEDSAPPFWGPLKLLYRDPPTPPPMSELFPKNPYKVLCHLCFQNPHYTMYNQCEFCHYRQKFAFRKL